MLFYNIKQNIRMNPLTITSFAYGLINEAERIKNETKTSFVYGLINETDRIKNETNNEGKMVMSKAVSRGIEYGFTAWLLQKSFILRNDETKIAVGILLGMTFVKILQLYEKYD